MQRWVEDTRMDVFMVNGEETITVPFCSFFYDWNWFMRAQPTSKEEARG